MDARGGDDALDIAGVGIEVWRQPNTAHALAGDDAVPGQAGVQRRRIAERDGEDARPLARPARTEHRRARGRAVASRQGVGDRADALLDRRRSDLQQQRRSRRRARARRDASGCPARTSRRRAARRSGRADRCRQSTTLFHPSSTGSTRSSAVAATNRNPQPSGASNHLCPPTAMYVDAAGVRRRWRGHRPPGCRRRRSGCRGRGRSAPSAARSVRKPDCQSTALTATTRVRASTAAAISSTPKRTRGPRRQAGLDPQPRAGPTTDRCWTDTRRPWRRRCRPRATAGRRRSATGRRRCSGRRRSPRERRR